jgi:phage replication O-like protein O
MVPNRFYEAALRLPGSSCKVAFAVFRLTHGWCKPDGDRISYSQIAELTGLHRITAIRRVKALLKAGVLRRTGTVTYRAARLSVETDPARWRDRTTSESSGKTLPPGSEMQPPGSSRMLPPLVAERYSPSGKMLPTKYSLSKKERKLQTKQAGLSGKTSSKGKDNTCLSGDAYGDNTERVKQWWIQRGFTEWRPEDHAACARLLDLGVPLDFIITEGDAILADRETAADGQPIRYFKYVATVVEDKWCLRLRDQEWAEIEKRLPNPSEVAGFAYLTDHSVPQQFWSRAVRRHKAAYPGQGSQVDEMFERWVLDGAKGSRTLYLRRPAHGGNGERSTD